MSRNASHAKISVDEWEKTEEKVESSLAPHTECFAFCGWGLESSRNSLSYGRPRNFLIPVTVTLAQYNFS